MAICHPRRTAVVDSAGHTPGMREAHDQPHPDRACSRLTFIACLALTAAALSQQPYKSAPENTGHMVSVGSYRLFLNCTGESTAPAAGPTVVLLNGGGSTADVWSKVQPEVSRFIRVCSYDREGSGRSELGIPPLQSAGDIVEDLHTLLINAGIPPPYILVGHSIGGIYARQFTEAYPALVSGLVFVDSADEEQVWRFERISHSLLFEYKAWPNTAKLAQEGFLPPGALLKWHRDVPLIVLEHGVEWPRGTFKGMTEAEYEQTKQTWHTMQRDLSTRSSCGELRVAEKSGHYIHKDQPELVIQAVHDVVSRPCTPP